MTMTTGDYDGIVSAVRLYIDGFNDRDITKFKRAFHEDAWMFWTNENGESRAVPLAEKVFRQWATPTEEHDPVQLRVLSVAQMGDAAGVALAFGDDWRDFHSLVRTGREWLITNKTASHSRLAGAVLTMSDYDSIVDSVQLYVDGWNDRDVDKLKGAFHEDAWMFHVDKAGALHTCPLTEAQFKSWAAHEDEPERVQLRVISVAQMGDAAQVAIAWGNDWLDFVALARFDGRWKMTNETASHSSR
ncbi:MAG TPA: nuclear transport factor 2 family protein [Acidimicrobiales bacterium]|nr:nuclear transport factor 2 family protein [Acidimicrobiales bacterium]